jgi:alpha 1,2-mannosyltransferase
MNTIAVVLSWFAAFLIIVLLSVQIATNQDTINGHIPANKYTINGHRPANKYTVKHEGDIPNSADYLLYQKETKRKQEKYPTKQVEQIKKLFNDLNQNVEQKCELDGRGIVICAGGFKYLTCAWVQITILRSSKCKLPIEIWHLKDEIPLSAIQPFLDLGVTFKDISKIVKFDWKGTFTPKILAVYYSSFREILFLDADNNCLRDPTYMFDSPEYKKYGTIFWPDYWKMESQAPIFDTYENNRWTEFCQESGQMLIDKGRCQKALEACLQISLTQIEHLQQLFPVPDNYGDKDIWMSAWNGTETSFYFIPFPTTSVGKYETNGQYSGNTMGQKDPEGNLLFLHKNIQKWHTVHTFPNWEVFMTSDAGDASSWVGRRGYELHGKSVKIMSFTQEFGNYEDLCWQVLDELRNSIWYKKLYSQLIPPRNQLWRQPILFQIGRYL